MTYSGVYTTLAIDQSVWQSVRDNIPIGESSNNCNVAVSADVDAGDGMQHFPVTTVQSLSVTADQYISADVVFCLSLRSSRTPLLQRLSLITITQPQYCCSRGLWLTYPGRFTVSRKTPLTVNRKVRPEGKRRDRRRVGSEADPGDGCD